MMLRQDEVGRLRDRCETLEEENRQLKETFAPIRVFPKSWGLRPAHHRILSCFLESPNGVRSDAQLRAVACHPDAECESIVKMQISYLRKLMKPHGVEIKTRYGVGYELPAASREILRAALT